MSHQFKISQDRVKGPDILYAVGLDHVRHHLVTTRPHSMTKKRLRQIQSGRPNVCYIFEKQEGFICPTNIAFIWITFLNQYVANFQKLHPYCLGKISLKYHKINVGAPHSTVIKTKHSFCAAMTKTNDVDLAGAVGGLLQDKQPTLSNLKIKSNLISLQHTEIAISCQAWLPRWCWREWLQLQSYYNS